MLPQYVNSNIDMAQVWHPKLPVRKYDVKKREVMVVFHSQRKICFSSDVGIPSVCCDYH